MQPLGTQLEDAFNSMLRADYIPLRDVAKLDLLAKYYVDYFSYMGQILSENDQLVVGRRGTGKTTLLYRALIECRRSWAPEQPVACKPKTLGLYLDLSKCQTLVDTESRDFTEFEHVFVSEMKDALVEELKRSWPEVGQRPGLLARIFRSAQSQTSISASKELKELADIITKGIPRTVDPSGKVDQKLKTKEGERVSISGSLGGSPKGPNATVSSGYNAAVSHEEETIQSYQVNYRLAITDILRVLGRLREAAEINHIVLFIDEFSSLSVELQRRFTTLLRKVLGNHEGLYIKLCAITDYYSLGSAIILQRDLFELSLDLDAFVERSRSLNSAMDGLRDMTRKIIAERLSAFTNTTPEQLLEDADEAFSRLSRTAMGVPRTLGIVLKQAWYRCNSAQRRRIQLSDIDYGIQYASKAYLNQFIGACGAAIPPFHEDIWNSLIERAIQERAKSNGEASHFMVLPRHDPRLRFLNMFFLVHLLTKGRTTKKEKLSRSLYVFDYGVCLENNLGFAEHKNVLRQQRFAYDTALSAFDEYFAVTPEPMFVCPACKTVYKRKDLMIGNEPLRFCPKDKTDLQAYDASAASSDYTEEEMKIIGAIRSSGIEDKLIARRVADDVGCYVQKVAKFGEKLDREALIARQRDSDLNKHIYFKPELTEGTSKSETQYASTEQENSHDEE